MAVALGGHSQESAPEYNLTAADFYPCTEEDRDEYKAPRKNLRKLEPKPKVLTNLTEWYKCVRAQCKTMALFYGLEWEKVWLEAADTLWEQNLHQP